MTDILISPELTDTDTGEPLVAHWVLKKDQMKGYIEGQPIIALCGKKWVPHRDPQSLPLCEECKQIATRRGFRGSN